MAFICEKHRLKKSFNGNFTIHDILVVNKVMIDMDSNVREFDFDEITCSNGYARLYDIFSTKFVEAGADVPLYFDHLLTYLFHCPAKVGSNSEPLIRFLTNHPSLTCYMDRIKQCLLLDNMVHRLKGKPALSRKIHRVSTWWNEARNAPVLEKVLLYDSWNDNAGNTILNSEYTNTAVGFMHFSKNYFTHDDYQVCN